MKAYITVKDFGDIAQRLDLCRVIDRLTGLETVLAPDGAPMLICDVIELGEVFAKVASNADTAWIEYTLQFEG